MSKSVGSFFAAIIILASGSIGIGLGRSTATERNPADLEALYPGSAVARESRIIFDLSYLSEQRIVAAVLLGGATKRPRGALMASSDGGVSWTKMSSPTDKCITSISFLDSRNGWLSCDSGLLMSTSDGGKTWRERGIVVQADPGGIQFSDTLHGHILGFFGEIFSTRDGGDHWIEGKLGAKQMNVPSMSFADWANGWIIGDGDQEFAALKGRQIFQTRDGGLTWKDRTREFAMPAARSQDVLINYRTVTFTSRAIGYIAADIEPRWDNQVISSPEGFVIGTRVAWGGIVFKTTDGGKQWKVLARFNETELLRGAFLGSHIWLISSSNSADRLLWSKDSGESWGWTEAPEGLWRLVFANGQIGCALGTPSDDGLGDEPIFYTTDGGKTWHESTFPSDL